MTVLRINGAARSASAAPDTPLLYVLRDEFGFNGAKFGCGLGQCGACTVLLDDRPTFSCLIPVSSVGDRAVTTVEGLGTATAPGRTQRAFEAEEAAQCGYCIAGMIMRAEGLLRRNPKPSEIEIRTAMAPNLCRCGTHMRILRAVRRAAGTPA
jgi:aerobic-type carbon monoxide dehydrogenase small subunit (CoxS/CutS family)